MPAGSMIRTGSGSSHLRARSEYRLMPEAWCAACTVDVCIVSRPHERTCERCFVFVHYLYAQHSLLRTRLYSQVSSRHPVGTPVGIPPRAHISIPQAHRCAASVLRRADPCGAPCFVRIKRATQRRWPHSHEHTHELAMPAPQPRLFEPSLSFGRLGLCIEAVRASLAASISAWPC